MKKNAFPAKKHPKKLPSKGARGSRSTRPKNMYTLPVWYMIRADARWIQLLYNSNYPCAIFVIQGKNGSTSPALARTAATTRGQSENQRPKQSGRSPTFALDRGRRKKTTAVNVNSRQLLQDKRFIKDSCLHEGQVLTAKHRQKPIWLSQLSTSMQRVKTKEEKEKMCNRQLRFTHTRDADQCCAVADGHFPR